MAHAEAAGAKPTGAAAEYLMTIRYMHGEGQPVIAARLAERLRVSAATVSEMVNRLGREGLLSVDGETRQLLLTDRGRDAAERTFRRHALAEWLLTEGVGLGWAEADEEAHRRAARGDAAIRGGRRRRGDDPARDGGGGGGRPAADLPPGEWRPAGKRLRGRGCRRAHRHDAPASRGSRIVTLNERFRGRRRDLGAGRRRQAAHPARARRPGPFPPRPGARPA